MRDKVSKNRKRWYGGRQLSAIYWDGATDYSANAFLDADGGAQEEEAETNRLEKFGDWIEDQELPPELQLQMEEKDATVTMTWK